MGLLRPPRVSELLWAASFVLLTVWVVFLFFGLRLSSAQWAGILPGFEETEIAFGRSPEGHIPKVIALFLLVPTVLLGAAALVVRFAATLQRHNVQVRIISAAVALGAVGVLFEDLAFRGQISSWYDVPTMMTHPGTVPVFGQRLLLIWPAMLLKHLAPMLSYIQSFLIVQLVGIVLAVYVIGEWSALFIGRELGFLGQLLLTVLLLPTSVFYQAHDIGVVFSYGFCFLFLYKRQYALFLIAFCIGMLNHQNILLLIPTALAVMWGREEARKIVTVGAIATIAYFSIQFILNKTIPLPATHEIKVWWNIRAIGEMRRAMVFGLMLTVPWYLGAAAAFRAADPFLKRASILLPMQLGIFAVVGQLNEARLFHGFLPILIGIYMCYIRRFIGKNFNADTALQQSAHSPAAHQYG
jgi:hypothetical protein